MKNEELFDFVKNEVKKAMKDEVCDIISQTDKVIHVFDDDYEKEFYLHNPKSMNVPWLKKKIVLTSSAKKSPFVPDVNLLASWLINHFDKKYYLNLNHMIFIYDDEADFDELYGKEEFVEMLDCHNFPEEHQLGIYWNEHDTVVISLKNILQTCKEYAEYKDLSKEMNIGVLTTILHELAHMGYSNPYVPDVDDSDSEFYSEDDEEECVEEIARTAYEQNPAYILVA